MHDFLLQIVKNGLILVLYLSAIPLCVSLVVGVLVSLFQATTQLQEQTLTFAPKLIAVAAALAITAPWIGRTLLQFTVHIFEKLPWLLQQ